MWDSSAIGLFAFLLSLPLTTTWGCKEIPPKQDPVILTPKQSYKSPLIHRSGIGRHPVGRWCAHVHTCTLLLLDQHWANPETSRKLDPTPTYL